MKVEVGDWVKVRGMKRIYVVEGFKAGNGTMAHPYDEVKLAGVPTWRKASDVEQSAPRFWIRKAGK